MNAIRNTLSWLSTGTTPFLTSARNSLALMAILLMSNDDAQRIEM
jgi:hypothetical protein